MIRVLHNIKKPICEIESLVITAILMNLHDF